MLRGRQEHWDALRGVRGTPPHPPLGAVLGRVCLWLAMWQAGDQGPSSRDNGAKYTAACRHQSTRPPGVPLPVVGACAEPPNACARWTLVFFSVLQARGPWAPVSERQADPGWGYPAAGRAPTENHWPGCCQSGNQLENKRKAALGAHEEMAMDWLQIAVSCD